MKVTFLGTGTSQGVPVIACTCEVCKSDNSKDQRLRASVLIELENQTIVIDTGPDFRQQMLMNQVENLDAVVFTHGHKDHTAGFDDIRGFNYKQKRAMDVYVDHQVEEVLRRDFYYCFTDFKYPGVPELNLHIIDEQEFQIGGTSIIPISLMHYKLPVFGYRIGDFTYITDANYISEEEKNKVRGSKVLVINALKKSSHISHFSLSEAIELAKELEIPTTYLTHMSHQMGLHEDVQAELPEGVYLSYDGLKIELD
ncbi:MAG: MBL fold metallo-hydrolase [Bacteroidia bacterium]